MQKTPSLWVLLAGDCIMLLTITILGFARHQTLGTAGARILTTFLPLVIAWLPVAWSLGVFDLRRATEPRQLWRPFWAMVLTGIMAAWLRSVWLQSVIIPVFAAVLSGVSAVGILVWRSLYCLVIYRER